MPQRIATILCMPWIVPLVWAIGVAHARRAANRGEITAAAICGPVMLGTLVFIFAPCLNANRWLAWIVASLLILVYLAFSWGAVARAHLGEREQPPRGFPIELIKPVEKIEE